MNGVKLRPRRDVWGKQPGVQVSNCLAWILEVLCSWQSLLQLPHQAKFCILQLRINFLRLFSQVSNNPSAVIFLLCSVDLEPNCVRCNMVQRKALNPSVGLNEAFLYR